MWTRRKYTHTALVMRDRIFLVHEICLCLRVPENLRTIFFSSTVWASISDNKYEFTFLYALVFVLCYLSYDATRFMNSFYWESRVVNENDGECNEQNKGKRSQIILSSVIITEPNRATDAKLQIKKNIGEWRLRIYEMWRFRTYALIYRYTVKFYREDCFLCVPTTYMCTYVCGKITMCIRNVMLWCSIMCSMQASETNNSFEIIEPKSLQNGIDLTVFLTRRP